MNQEERELRKKLILNFELFAKHALIIPHKQGADVPFVLNRAQKYLHDIAEEQLKDKGYVRILILKGRQQGCSTYVAGRFYWKITQSIGKRARVMAHTSETGDMLFDMTKKYHDNCPKSLKPQTGSESSKKYTFPEIDGMYRVSTANSGQSGRGGTLQYFHGSEVAFWDKAEDIFAGAIKSIPSGKFMGGTEIFLESTSGGPGGVFYDLWMEAEKGNNLYIPVFIPWWWQDEYANEIPKDGVRFNDSEIEYQEETGISDEQLLWRRYEIAESGLKKFKREYPKSVAEAFEYAEEDTFMDRDDVTTAALDKNLSPNTIGTRVGAFDPSGGKKGGDDAGLAWGDDVAIRDMTYLSDMDTYQQEQEVGKYIDANDLDWMWIDVTGIGLSIYNNMRNGKHKDTVKPFVSAGSSSDIIRDKLVYVNQRAQAAGRFRKWLGDGTLVQIPSEAKVISELCAPKEIINESSGAIQVEAKKDMKKRKVPSPTAFDLFSMIKAESLPSRNFLTNAREYDTVTSSYNVLDLGLL